MDNVTLIRRAGCFCFPSTLVCLTYDTGVEENAQDADPFAEPVSRMDSPRLDRSVSVGIFSTTSPVRPIQNHEQC
jgi:hypothetical protein